MTDTLRIVAGQPFEIRIEGHYVGAGRTNGRRLVVVRRVQRIRRRAALALRRHQGRRRAVEAWTDHGTTALSDGE